MPFTKQQIIKKALYWHNKSFFSKKYDENDIKINTVQVPVYYTCNINLIFSGKIYDYHDSEITFKEIDKIRKLGKKILNKHQYYDLEIFSPNNEYEKYKKDCKEFDAISEKSKGTIYTLGSFKNKKIKFKQFIYFINPGNISYDNEGIQNIELTQNILDENSNLKIIGKLLKASDYKNPKKELDLLIDSGETLYNCLKEKYPNTKEIRADFTYFKQDYEIKKKYLTIYEIQFGEQKIKRNNNVMYKIFSQGYVYFFNGELISGVKNDRIFQIFLKFCKFILLPFFLFILIFYIYVVFFI